jgi:hypothetical protein
MRLEVKELSFTLLTFALVQRFKKKGMDIMVMFKEINIMYDLTYVIKLYT